LQSHQKGRWIQGQDFGVSAAGKIFFISCKDVKFFKSQGMIRTSKLFCGHRENKTLLNLALVHGATVKGRDGDGAKKPESRMQNSGNNNQNRVFSPSDY
jgi:hypothetical protein